MQNILDVFVQEFVTRSPDIAWALIIFVFGLIVASRVKNLVISFFDKIRLNHILRSLGWESFFDRFEAKMNIAKFFGIIVEIYFIFLFLTISLDVLKLSQVNTIVGNVINYYPNIFIAMIIFIFAVYIADFSKKIIIGKMDQEKITYSNFLGNTISIGTWILAILAILYQLQIVQTLVLSIFIGVISLIVLSVGIAFGLGGKDMAAKLLEDIEKRVR
ncbi:MAG: hypothetical protein PHD31_01740 [Candidatus Pacebacteria bacterium]|nr:hypothetical protein [Candidatus Paceibacterota bacterium]